MIANVEYSTPANFSIFTELLLPIFYRYAIINVNKHVGRYLCLIKQFYFDFPSAPRSHL